MKKLKKLGLLTTVVFVLGMVGCYVYSTGSVTVGIDPAIDCTKISSIKVEVYKDPANRYLTGDSFDCSLGQVTVEDIPVGSNTRVVVSAIGIDDTLRYQGEKGSITISRNETTDVGVISLSRSELNNSIGMVLKFIPAGTFTMGSPKHEPGRDLCSWDDCDETQHTVTLTRPFYIQTTEVTQGQWEAVMGEGTNPSEYPEDGDDCPVETVTWFDCVIFCNRLSQIEGLTPSYYADSTYTTVFAGTPPVESGTVYWNQNANGYRLPTEAQWEYAARAGSTTAFANGHIRFYKDMIECNVDPNLDAMGWYCGNMLKNDSRLGMPRWVAQKDANAWGLFDMHGNVIEWCQDWYGTYPSGTVMDPLGPSSGSGRVFRGGSWTGFASECRSATRYGFEPGIRGGDLGFRLALPPGQPGESSR